MKKFLINLPYTVLTTGSKEKNLSIGFGYNLQEISSGDMDAIDRLALNVGGITRTSRRFSLVFEAWLVNIGDDEPIALGGPGVRYYRKINRVSAKNGAGSKTFDIQLFMSSLINGSIIPMFRGKSTILKFMKKYYLYYSLSIVYCNSYSQIIINEFT